ncbi:hypothetical protein PRIPAC_88268 [Pristionchus pacificus]|uniref:Uncharacterized protein n=1 Tax=Pristionchus pacificus TaxID=54126 RepID=A0A2A6CTT6_PRIPA|nr:hypothetical protein PRIPAC_88268 [Pristionchus pacificus]|eukprot:PDM81528.1 hypothetical protein PRIPAC_35404 [Pristionchus pacificus]
MRYSILPVALLLLFLLPSIFSINDTEPTFSFASIFSWNSGDQPAFNESYCKEDASVRSILHRPIAAYCPQKNRKKVFEYGNGKSFRLNGVQVIMRHFNNFEKLLEIWVDGPSAALKDNEGKTIFGCTSKKATSDIPSAEIKFIKGNTASSGKTYCRFKLTSHRKEIIQRPKHFDEHQEQLKKKGYTISEIPYENLFSEVITCPEGSVLMYEIDGEQFDAVYIECKIDAGFHYFIKGVNGDRIEKNGNF